MGPSCAPYLSTSNLDSTLHPLMKGRVSLASYLATLHHFYVDDFTKWCRDRKKKKLNSSSANPKGDDRKGGFNLRKWQSNSETVIKEVSKSKILKWCAK
ncbi:hypothetical protein TNIN_289061 [Trichonephila inaurata madagascariensis]|uniref:Uncharacterized protein n=1 Tax=Trichonephila inaurata madagascariensis TaxID=2747483 RepID=A0A8X6MM47_9ARAC|nr:hypothetical protein TNIN_289061 [Trichonephila inaurata madagascariensis]